MTEEEALIRAREAVAANADLTRTEIDAIRKGVWDTTVEVVSATRALLDLDKPLPVDRDLADLREIMADRFGEPYDVEYRRGDYDHKLKDALPTFRAIIQRRIEEGVKAWKQS